MTSPRRSSRPQLRRPPKIRMRTSKIALAAFAGLAILQSRDALAVDRQWIGLGDANWNDSGNWISGNIPSDGDIADIVNNDAFVRAVEYNYNGTAITLAGLLLSNTGAGSTTFVINGNALTTANATIGGGGNATVNQGGGTFAVNNNFSFVNGSYNLTGGQFSVSGKDYIGDNGTATFTQFGGTHIATASFAIGIGSTGNGTYNLHAGTLNTNGEDIGISGGRGTLNQRGGDHDASALRVGAIGFGGIGLVNLSGGTLNAPTVILGGSGNTATGVGILNVTGGNLTASTGITIYNTSIGTNASGITINGGTISTPFIKTPDWSRLNLTGGTLNLTGGVSSNTGTLSISGSANPILNLSGGSIYANSEIIGNNFGSTGTYNLGNSATLSVATSEYVGYGGTGVFNQTGGMNSSTNGYLYLGCNPGSSGTYNLSNSATLSIFYGLEFVGLSGTGVFNQTGGTNFGDLILAANSGSIGTYNLSGSATLGRVGYGRDVSVGIGGTGVFNQTGGTNFSHLLRLGNNVGSIGTYNLSDSAMLAVNDAEFIGGQGSGICGDCGGTNTTGAGVFNQTGGSNTSRLLLVGGNSGGLGTYNLSGAGVLAVSDSEYVNGWGVFNQTGGSNTTPGFYIFGYAGGIGTYNMSNTATLSVVGAEMIGFNNGASVVSNETGVFNQTGGSNTTGTLILANRVGAIGNYNLGGGTLSAPSLYIGGSASASGGTGNLNINGGVLTATTITVWNNYSSLNLGGGTLAATSVVNNGLFNQTGGISNLGALGGAGSLIVGGAGTVLASADSLIQSNVTVTTNGTLNIGPATGLIQPVTISNALTITNNANVIFVPTGKAATITGVKTNFVKTLNIGANGLLDLQNHFISVDNTATPFAKVHGYIDDAYNRNPVTGIGDYNGRGGITSSIVKNNADFMGVGYYNGVLQDPANPDNIGQILGPNSNSGAGTKMPLNQILIRPTLTGDLNGDGVVNAYDVTLFNSFGLFNQPTNLGYQAGDLNGDGIVNAKDVTIFNSAGNFNSGSYLVAKAAKAATTLTGHSASPASTVLSPDGGVLGFTYDFGTGGLKVNYHGFTGFAGKPLFNSTNHALSLIDIISTGGAFALDPTKISTAASTALSSQTITGNTEINLTAVNGYLPDGTDLGPILAPGLDLTQLANALTLTFNYTGSRSTGGGVAGLIPITPEPATLSLIGFGALGLLSRRRVRTARH